MAYSKDIISPFFVIGAKDFRITSELQALLKEFPISGIALFNSPFDSPDNIWGDREGSLEALYEFVTKTKDIPFIAVDQEGGRVRRLRGAFIELPSPQKISEAYENPDMRQTIKRLLNLTAKQMSLSGINLNFAPDCDLRASISNKDIMGDRSFGTQKDQVVVLAKLFCETFEKAQVHTCLKHFPGHGPTRIDSHKAIAIIEKPLDEYQKEDVKTFHELAPHASALMTAHIAFEDDPERIVSMDRKLLDTFSKGMPKELIWITDDVATMKAVSELNPWVRAFDAEYDLILTCGTLERSVRAIEETIYHFEQKKSDFALQLKTEKRSFRSRNCFFENRKRSLPPFNRWREEMLELENQGKECLETLGL